MMAANNCGDAFWLGNLKNRDLEGEEILSQVEEEGEEEEGEEESKAEEEEEGTNQGSGSVSSNRKLKIMENSHTNIQPKYRERKKIKLMFKHINNKKNHYIFNRIFFLKLVFFRFLFNYLFMFGSDSKYGTGL